ncbi:MAG: competence/damage-inducible protein A [Alphaproteobacteria bacterium]|nr:competence/damage-inducible protein A [Alphaproteobacteria bacterium]NDC55926.1 competence/damage-inducible protein A [Alphaproteobacteria bacterium]NDG04406.1 competence/damage-inducible protein A [Alphaproteobacteria bacterium]
MAYDQFKKAAVLIIGNEILSGRTREANLAYIAEKLAQNGIIIKEARVISDDVDVIVEHLNVLRNQYAYVFTTGGIGPTHDDMTIESVAKAFGVPVVEDAHALELLKKYYGDKLNEARRRMARIPEGATLIHNPISAAPGANIGNVYVLPGVPSIMQAMVDGLMPSLAGGPPVVASSIACAAPESMLADDLAAIASDFADVAIGSYPAIKNGQYALSLVVRGADAARVNAAAKKILLLAQKLDPTAILQAD